MGFDLYILTISVSLLVSAFSTVLLSGWNFSNESALQVRGTDYKTSDGTCIRDYIDVTDLVDAHVKALEHAQPRKVGIYNVGTGKGKINETNTTNCISYCAKICCSV